VKSQRERDRSVEHLLQRSLTPGDSPIADACPDPETLAAWVDGGLDEREVALVEAHSSVCARCQALLAAVVEASPESSRPALQDTWGWGRSWSLRWLVPLAATATAAAILWVALPNGERTDLPAQAKVESANADRFNAQTANPKLPDAGNETTAKAENKPASTRATAREQRKADATPKDKREAQRLDTLGARDAGASPAPASPSAAQPQSAMAETAARLRAPFRPGLLEIASPDPSVRWRIAPGGSVERTTNGGTTWEAVPTGVGADLTAGASPSATVCWLVGRAGMVLLSTDGRTWRQLPFPEMVDLAAVQAADARTATVTTAAGRMFRTTDGGLTWN
jgi:photosystem II stability/assembly factor-like uncharacterized protein